MDIVINRYCCGVVSEWGEVLCDVVAVKHTKVFGITIWKDIVYCDVVSKNEVDTKKSLEKCIEHINNNYPHANIIVDNSIKHMYNEIVKSD